MNGRLPEHTRFDRADVDLMFWLSALAAASVFLLRFGYDFGMSDQDEFLPWLAHLADPSVLANDWFVGIQDASFNVRTVFVRALLPLSLLLGTGPAVHAVYAVSFAGVCLGVYRLGLGLHRGHPVLAAAGVVLAVAITARWNPGGNDVAAAVLAPSMPAWAFALNAVATVLRGRLTTRRAVVAAVLITLATSVQGLVGLQAAAVCAVLVLAVDRSHVRAIWIFFLLVILGAALTVIPLLAESGLFAGDTLDSALPSGSGSETTASITPVEILAAIRAPHHYLPSAFGFGRWIRFWLIAAAGIAFLWRRPDQTYDAVRFRTLVLVGVVLGTLVVFRLWIALDPLGPVVLLQPFKLTVLLRVVCAVAAVGWFHRIARFGRLAMTALCIPTLFVLLGLYTGLLDTNRVFPFTERGESSTGDVHAWIESRTAEDAVIAVPPAHTGFSWATGRAQYVNFKAVPYSDEDLVEWLRRLREVAPFDARAVGTAAAGSMDGTAGGLADGTASGSAGGTELLDRLERVYHGRHPTQLRAVMSAESIDYVLARRGRYFVWPTTDASYCNEDWCVYSVDDLNSIDEWRYATD